MVCFRIDRGEKREEREMMFNSQSLFIIYGELALCKMTTSSLALIPTTNPFHHQFTGQFLSVKTILRRLFVTFLLFINNN